MKGTVTSWIPAPPSVIGGLDLDDELGSTTVAELDHQNLLPHTIPNTKFGSVRSASMVHHRFASLHITEQNVITLLKLAGGPEHREERSTKEARELVNYITRWDDVLVLNGADLDELESQWTGVTRQDQNAPDISQTAEFYVFLEYRCFLNSSWDIIKEITCLATTKPAFQTLTLYANFQVRHRGLERLSDTLRPCGSNVFYDCIDCLRCGSPWQTLLAAITATLISLYPLPTRKRTDFTPPADALGFGYIRHSRLKPFIQKFMRLGCKAPRGAKTRERLVMRASGVYEYVGTQTQNWVPTDLSFHRQSAKTVQIRERDRHSQENCARCLRSNTTDLFKKGFDARLQPVLSAYGAILVESLVWTSPAPIRTDRYDLCLYVLQLPSDVKDGYGDVVKALTDTDLLYHTILHLDEDPERLTQGIVWNLPCSYRPSTKDQRANITDWILELKTLYVPPESPPEPGYKLWENLQSRLMYLSKGYSYPDARKAAAKLLRQIRESPYIDMYELFTRLEHEKKHGKDVPMPGSYGGPIFPPSKLTLRGDDVAYRDAS